MLDQEVRTDHRQAAEEASPPFATLAFDEMVCRIGGRHMYLWRAVDDEGEVLEVANRRTAPAMCVDPAPTNVPRPLLACRPTPRRALKWKSHLKRLDLSLD